MVDCPLCEGRGLAMCVQVVGDEPPRRVECRCMLCDGSGKITEAKLEIMVAHAKSLAGEMVKDADAP